MNKVAITNVIYVVDEGLYTEATDSNKDDVSQFINNQIVALKNSSDSLEATLITYSGGFEPVVRKTGLDWSFGDIVGEFRKPVSKSESSKAMAEALSLALAKKGGSPSLVIVLSGGYESSHLSGNDKTVTDLVKKSVRGGRTTIVLAGANQDHFKTSKHLGLYRGNIIRLDLSTSGMRYVCEVLKSFTGQFLLARRFGTLSTRGFFGTDHLV